MNNKFWNELTTVSMIVNIILAVGFGMAVR